MALPTEVDDAVSAARSTLSGSSGALSLPLRIAIWRLFGDVEPPATPGTITAGHRRRAELAIQVVEHGLAEWEAHWPTREPHDLVALVKAYLAGYASVDDLWAAQNTHTLSEEPTGDDRERTSLVADAACDAAVTAANDADLDDPTIEDEDIDPDAWDAAFLMSCVFAGGPPWFAESDPEARRAFWTWYLDVAISALYPD